MQIRMPNRLNMTEMIRLLKKQITVYITIRMTMAKKKLKPERCLSGEREDRRHRARREDVSKSVQL